MSFLYPLGLLGLLAIPVLVIIYIIKSKYTEQVIPSTYLWTLSERFLKRKNPIQRITGIVSLILQILAVVFISLAIAHPSFVLPGKANDYCFILDCTGSMNYLTEEGDTRFALGKSKIAEMISSAADGSNYTLVTAGNTAEEAFNTDNKKTALSILESIQPEFVARGFDGALEKAQKLFNENPAYEIFAVTDKTFTNVQNVQLISVAAEAVNCALTDVEYSFTGEGGTLVTGKAVSYSGAASVTVELFADDGEAPVATASLNVGANEGSVFSLGYNKSEFSCLRVAIKEQDDLPLDNAVNLYSVHSDSDYRALIISDKPFFINAALGSMDGLACDVVAPAEYTEAIGTGYGLYVFDGCSPAKMPSDGAVWFVNPDAGVEGSGFSRRGEEELEGVTNLMLSESSSTKVKNLLKGVVKGDDTGISQYVKCGLYRTFYTLMSCNGDPVVFAGSNNYGNREVVIAFDLNKSDFPMTFNGRAVIHNLINYTFPALVDETSFYCGETLPVNVLANCTGIRVQSPSGKAEYLDTSEAICEYELGEVGVYSVTATVGNSQRSVNVFSMLPEAERIPSVNEANFIIVGEPSGDKRDGKYEDLLYAFIILAVIVAADWMVYCYEQYQLR